MHTKICARCKVEKPREEFYSRGDGTLRVQAKCKECCAASAEDQRIWRRNNPDKVKNAELKRRFGITLEDYNELLKEQGGRCAICGEEAGRIGTGGRSVGTLAVDHDHSTGIYRGLLCTNCNLGLGSFRDDVGRLEAAIAYLQAHRKLVQKVLLQKSLRAAEATLDASELLSELVNGP